MKDLRFVGFDHAADLEAELRQRVPALEAELGRFAERVEVEYELRRQATDKPFLWLTLTLGLPQVGAETNAAVAPVDELREERAFRGWVRHVWGGVLDKVLEEQARRVERDLVEALGA